MFLPLPPPPLPHLLFNQHNYKVKKKELIIDFGTLMPNNKNK